MEQAKKMLSHITETDSEIIITTPKKKSWILIILFSLMSMQFSNSVIQMLFFVKSVSFIGRLAIALAFLAAIYFVLIGILWQILGKKEIRIDKSTLTYRRLSPLYSNKKEYNLEDIKTIDIRDETVSEGPLAMLQILGIKDKIQITFTYGYETISLIGGIDFSEASELKMIIERKLQSKLAK